jgi:hypothetical protein
MKEGSNEDDDALLQPIRSDWQRKRICIYISYFELLCSKQ